MWKMDKRLQCFLYQKKNAVEEKNVIGVESN